MNFQVVGESAIQAVTEDRTIGVRLISLINKGESVLVKMAFRVRTELEEKKKGLPQKKGEVKSAPGQAENLEPQPPSSRVAAEKRPLPEPPNVAAFPGRSSEIIASAETDRQFRDIRVGK